ncbi:winged helix-turn-helix domain-containing protein [soil metagenome]
MTTESAASEGIDLDALGRIGFALASDTRRRILVALIDGGVHPAQLAEQLDTSRTNVSNHLACLRGCGLVTATPHGRRMRYQLADPRLREALRQLSNLVALPDPLHPHMSTEN